MFYLMLILWVTSIVLVWLARDWIQKEKGWLVGGGVLNWTLTAVSYINVPILPLALVDYGLQDGLEKWLGSVCSVAGFTFVMLCIFKFAGIKGSAKHNDGNGNFLRGGKRVKAEPYKKLERHILEVESKTGRRPTTIGKVCIHQDEELLNFFFAGSPGSGKSQAIFEVLEAVRKRQERSIIFDESGDFIRRFYKNGDLLFNPYDQRSVRWSIMNEIRTPKDCATVAHALIPEPLGGGDAKEWAGYSRDILTVILRQMLERKERSNRTLYEWVMIRPISDLKQLCAGTPAQRAFEEGTEKMTASVMNMLSLAMARWQDVDDGDFSIRDFVQDNGPKTSNGGQFLFLVADANSIKQTAPIYLSLLNLAAVYLNTLEEDQTRRLWFALDELPALDKPLNELGALLNRARKRGGITLIGMQSVKYFHQIYGREAAETLMAGIGTLLVLRTNSEQGAKELAAELGMQDLMRVQRGENRNDSGSGTSMSYQHIQDYKLVSPTEVVNLGPRRGFLKLPGDNPIIEVEIPISPILPQERVPYFVEKNLPTIGTELKGSLKPMGEGEGARSMSSTLTDTESDDLVCKTANPEIQLGADPAHELDGFDWGHDNQIDGLGNEIQP